MRRVCHRTGLCYLSEGMKSERFSTSILKSIVSIKQSEICIAVAGDAFKSIKKQNISIQTFLVLDSLILGPRLIRHF